MTKKADMPTVLIVDDNHENIRILIETLKDEFKLLAASSGDQALYLLKSGPKLPDLILLDILMPGVDGYEVCRKLKHNDRTRHIPIIFVTAISEVMDETKGFRLGAADYITKPYHPPIVKARIKTQINLKNKTDMLEQLASIDGLTNIPNRRKFDEVLQNEWQRALRYQFPLSVIMIDVDQFKQYNDHYGHATGDECLRQIADALGACLKRPYDFIARYGGEEFVVILPDVDTRGAFRIADAMKQAVADLDMAHERSDVSPHVSISAGVATALPGGSITACRDLVAAADRQMYQAKKDGRNRIAAANPDAGSVNV